MLSHSPCDWMSQEAIPSHLFVGRTFHLRDERSKPSGWQSNLLLLHYAHDRTEGARRTSWRDERIRQDRLDGLERQEGYTLPPFLPFPPVLSRKRSESYAERDPELARRREREAIERRAEGRRLVEVRALHWRCRERVEPGHRGGVENRSLDALILRRRRRLGSAEGCRRWRTPYAAAAELYWLKMFSTCTWMNRSTLREAAPTP